MILRLILKYLYSKACASSSMLLSFLWICSHFDQSYMLYIGYLAYYWSFLHVAIAWRL